MNLHLHQKSGLRFSISSDLDASEPSLLHTALRSPLINSKIFKFENSKYEEKWNYKIWSWLRKVLSRLRHIKNAFAWSRANSDWIEADSLKRIESWILQNWDELTRMKMKLAWLKKESTLRKKELTTSTGNAIMTSYLYLFNDYFLGLTATPSSPTIKTHSPTTFKFIKN